jgi:hypothetical protein
MRRWRARLALLVLGVTLAGGLWLRRDRLRPWVMEAGGGGVEAREAEAGVSVAGGVARSQAEEARAGSPLVEALLRREGPPERDLELVGQLISQYHTALQNAPGPPIGDNRDLVRALTGRNPLRLAVIPPGHGLVGADGQLRDRWGTPYHLHKLTERYFEVRSAGPDRRLFTADDLVGR